MVRRTSKTEGNFIRFHLDFSSDRNRDAERNSRFSFFKYNCLATVCNEYVDDTARCLIISVFAMIMRNNYRSLARIDFCISGLERPCFDRSLNWSLHGSLPRNYL